MVKFKNDIKQTAPTQRQKHLRSVFSFKLAETVPCLDALLTRVIMIPSAGTFSQRTLHFCVNQELCKLSIKHQQVQVNNTLNGYVLKAFSETMKQSKFMKPNRKATSQQLRKEMETGKLLNRNPPPTPYTQSLLSVTSCQ